MTVDEIISMLKEYCEEFELGRGAELTFEVLIRGAYEFGRSEGATSEREACAAICDRFQARDVGMQPAECAGAIRARGNT